MKNLTNYALGLLAVSFLACESSEDTTTADLKSIEDSVSYSYGVQIAESLKQSKIKDIDMEILSKAIKESMTDKSQLTLDQCNEVIQRKEIGAGMNYLAENKKKEGVVTTESGLQYKVIQSGNGKTPAATSMVTTHYTGKLVDGTVFDSSVERGEPIQFPVNGVISGWTEALQMMKEGDKWELVIPSELAYGRRGAGGVIPPNAVLVFEVELISVDN